VKVAIVEVLRANCPFAIKGGGHSSNSEGSSIQDGVQFDLVNLNHIEIADDEKTVRVGPGVRWGPLLQVLEKRGVIAVGGRDFGVGVPGFIFGGKFFLLPYKWKMTFVNK
jgi:FAD/FMN-containing dehydrogenase